MNTPHQVRQAFKAIGYRASIRRNPLNGQLANLVVSGKGLEGMLLSSATVIPKATFEQRRDLFDLANSIRGTTVGSVKIS